MRLALLTNFLPPYRLPLLRELLRPDRKIEILLSVPVESNRDWPVDWQDLPVKVQRSLHLHKNWTHRHAFSEPSTIHFPYDTIFRLLSIRPDVIISGELGLRTIQSAMYCFLFRKTRLIIWATLSEITELDRGAFRAKLRRLLLRAAHAVMVNGSSGERYVASFGVPLDRIFRVPQTTDISRFLGVERRSSSALRLLYSGRLAESKGLVPFLERLSAWASAHPTRMIELTFAGDGPIRPQLDRSPISPNLGLHFLGHVPYDRLPDVYGASNLLVFPSLADEWGLVVVEALAAGLPVLGSVYSPAVEELVQVGVNGWTFRPDHRAELDEAISTALESAEEWSAMGTRAREGIRDATPARMAKQIDAAIQYACAQRA